MVNCLCKVDESARVRILFWQLPIFLLTHVEVGETQICAGSHWVPPLYSISSVSFGFNFKSGKVSVLKLPFAILEGVAPYIDWATAILPPSVQLAEPSIGAGLANASKAEESTPSEIKE